MLGSTESAPRVAEHSSPASEGPRVASEEPPKLVAPIDPTCEVTSPSPVRSLAHGMSAADHWVGEPKDISIDPIAAAVTITLLSGSEAWEEKNASPGESDGPLLGQWDRASDPCFEAFMWAGPWIVSAQM
jgi:hypothetical protein